MEHMKLCESDYRFMTVIWDHEPLPSGKLVELCAEKLGWKKPTTYTTLKKLCDGLDITLGKFFSTPEFDALEQEIK